MGWKGWTIASSLSLTLACFAQSITPSVFDDPSQMHLEERQRKWAVEQVEAGYISTFPYYVQWPQEVFLDHPDTIYIGLLGRNTLGKAGRDYLAQHGYLDFSFVVQDADPDYTAETLSGYQMLYIGDDVPETEMRHILNLVGDQPVLTMSRQDRFLHNGGIIQLKVSLNAVTWDVDLNNAHRAGLRIDPRLAVQGQIMSQPWKNIND
jgi:hypothetical protein